MKKRLRYAAAFLLAVMLLIPAVTAQARNYALAKYNGGKRWRLIAKEELKTDTDRLIYVRYTGGTRAKIQMYKKVEAGKKMQEENKVKTETTVPAEDNTVVGSARAAASTVKYKWKRIYSVNGYVGRNGINKVRQGDVKTPTGTFAITMAFGRKQSPGTAGMAYTKLNKYHYWSGEKATYNRFIDVREIGRKSIAGEHLITYVPFYNYALAMDYNKDCVYLKGSAIFMHCAKPGRPYTGGCVAVSEKIMKKTVQNTTMHTKICIYPQ